MPISYRPAPEGARERFSYDPQTGFFYRIATRKKKFIGTRADVMAPNGYRRVEVARRYVDAQRLAWFLHYGEWPECFIDHINGDTTDNRISNLRKATPTQSNQNKKSYGKLLKGVRASRDGGFAASIKVDGKKKELGWFATEQAAHDAYRSAARHFFGEFARAV